MSKAKAQGASLTQARNRIVAVVTAIALAFTMTTVAPLSAYAANGDWQISKSKTATNLDENYESQVTLSLPSAEEQLVTDVVFVLDKSTSPALEQQALDMLADLRTEVEDDNAKVKVGVVIFNKEANVITTGDGDGDGFFDLATEYEAIEAAVKTEIKSGTNTHAGLLAGKDLLDSDKTVSADRKYLIFVSDGITYMYNSEPTATAWSFNQPNSKEDWYGPGSFGTFAGPDNWYSKYHTNNAPTEGWTSWLNTIGKQVEAQGTTYEYLYGGTITTATPEDQTNWDKDYAMSIDKALYLTYTTYQSAVQAGYKCYAVVGNTGSGEQYTWGPSFMNYLAGDSAGVSFENIKNDIYYLVDKGSYVVDVIGKDFDFVNDASKLSVEVGEAVYAAKAIDTTAGATSTYAFGNENEYVVDYYANGKDGQSSECFIWTIKVPVTNFKCAQLTYSVKLTNPATEPGTYGEYDADGSENLDGLKTNDSATLYPVDSNGKPVDPELFPEPTVSYTVAEEPVAPVTPEDPKDEPTKIETESKPLAKTGDSTLPIVAVVSAIALIGAGVGVGAWRKMH